MKKDEWSVLITGVLVIGLILGLPVRAQPIDARLRPTQQQIKSYALGYDAGSMIAGSIPSYADVDQHYFDLGYEDSTHSKGLRQITSVEYKQAISTLEHEHAQSNSGVNKKVVSTPQGGLMRLAQEKAFFVQNAHTPGVHTLMNGIQYRVIQPGLGVVTPAMGDDVLVNYRVRYLDGKVFADTFRSGAPLNMPLNEAIMGWRDVLPHMRKGAEWEIYVPSRLAYGPDGLTENGKVLVPPNQALVYKVRMLDFHPVRA